MIVDLKKLNQYDLLLKEIKLIKDLVSNNTEKRWLSTRELSKYLDYSQDRIHKLKGSEFLEGIHYHKRSGKLLFNKQKIDDWVRGIETHSLANPLNVEESINNIIEDLLTS